LVLAGYNIFFFLVVLVVGPPITQIGAKEVPDNLRNQGNFVYPIDITVKIIWNNPPWIPHSTLQLE
jgi:hypothetical protein